MFQIVISGPASAVREATDEELSADELLEVSGARYDEEELSDHIDKPRLAKLGITGGTLRVVYDEDRDELRVISEYAAENELSETELDLLVDFTTAQWSDGLGDDFVQAYVEETGVSLSLYEADNDIEVEQHPD